MYAELKLMLEGVLGIELIPVVFLLNRWWRPVDFTFCWTVFCTIVGEATTEAGWRIIVLWRVGTIEDGIAVAGLAIEACLTGLTFGKRGWAIFLVILGEG